MIPVLLSSSGFSCIVVVDSFNSSTTTTGSFFDDDRVVFVVELFIESLLFKVGAVFIFLLFLLALGGNNVFFCIGVLFGDGKKVGIGNCPASGDDWNADHA